MSDFYTEKKVKARKQHKCELCTDLIEKGEIYLKSVSVWEGDFNSYKRHLKCAKILDSYLSDIGYGEYSLDDFGDWLNEKYCRACKNYEDRDCNHDKEPINCGMFESKGK